jgi:hypothetical protein
MRWLTLAVLALALGAGRARAELPAAVCQPYSSQWERVSGGSDVRAMEKVVASIPVGCSLRLRATEHLEGVKRRLGEPKRAPKPKPPAVVPPTPPQTPPGPVLDRPQVASTIEDIDERFDVGRMTLATRDSEYRTAVTQLMGGAGAASGAAQSQALLAYASGTIALDESRPADAAKTLRGVDATLDRGDPNYAKKLARVLGRLGEAYRLNGQPDDARRALEAANASFRGVDNYNAELQLILLDLDKRDFAHARHDAGTLVFQRTETRAGLAEAYAALARAQWGDAPNQEPAVWKDIDLAFAADSANLQAKTFADTLPTRLLGPDLNGQPPATISFNDVESQARTCYESAGDRDAYLGSVTKEVGRIGKYINAINQYLETLGQRDRGYQARGYDFHETIMREIDRWKGPGEAAKKRSDALSGAWFPYVAAKVVPSCTGLTPTRLEPPSDYDPAKPASTAAP